MRKPQIQKSSPLLALTQTVSCNVELDDVHYTLDTTYSDKILRELGELAGGMQYPGGDPGGSALYRAAGNRSDVSKKYQAPPSDVAC